MKISVRNLEPTKVKLTVTVEPEELNPYLDAARKEIAKQVNVPGFRKGHVPGKIIDQRIGFAAVAGEAVNDAVPELYSKALDEKKGREISAIEITDITTLADYFVIATGSSNTQINALCGSVEKLLEEQAGEKPLRREGYRDGTWVLLDYGCICVHVFSAEARSFYDLERLWADGKPLDLTGVLTRTEPVQARKQAAQRKVAPYLVAATAFVW